MEAGRATGGKVKRALGIEALDLPWLGRVDREANSGLGQDSGIFLDRVIGFHLEAPAGRPCRDADILFGEKIGDLVGLDGVVKGARLVAELVADIEHHRHFVGAIAVRSEEHTSELQSLMRISYDVFCLKKKKNNTKLVTTI